MSAAQDAPFTMDEYWRTRNFKTSARLHLQHELFQDTMGFYLHPRITEILTAPDAKERTFRVADIGCSNARWLCKLAKTGVPEGTKVEFHGVDINPVNFPNSANIPSNIQLRTLDILMADLPGDLVGTFDVVHLRAFISLIYNNDPSVVLKAATRLLNLVAGFNGKRQRVTDIQQSVFVKAQKLFSDWLYKLDSHFQEWNLQDTELITFDKKPEDYKAWTDDYLLVFEDIGPMLPSKASSPDAPVTRETWQNLFFKAVEETDNGVVIHQQQLIVAIGRKTC